MNDALIKRDKYVRDTYNVNLEFFLDQELEKSITQQVLANDCEFDFVIGTMRTMMQNMTLSGLLSDLNTLPYLSLEDVWWCKGAADNLHIRDSLYFTEGPITPQFYFHRTRWRTTRGSRKPIRCRRSRSSSRTASGQSINSRLF